MSEVAIHLHIETLEEGGYLATSPDVPGLVAEGRSVSEAVEIAQGLARKITDDAHHVAIATAERVDMIVSWNFQHIVHFDKIRGFNAVNLREGYSPIEIRSPKEVV